MYITCAIGPSKLEIKNAAPIPAMPNNIAEIERTC